MTRLRADLLLLVVAFIWGTAFIAQKHANDSMGPVSFVGARFFLSWIALSPLAFYEAGTPDRGRLTRGDLGLAFFIGLCLFTGAALQQIGLAETSATNGGFLTAVYVIFVPFIAWLTTGAKPRAIVLFACAISIVGAWLLMQAGGGAQHWTSGDALVLLAAIAWAGAIGLVPAFLNRAQRPFFLAFAQFGVTAILGLSIGFGLEPLSGDGLARALPAILYAGLLSGGVAFTLQIVAQKYTPPAEAALIMSLESIFAALAGAVLLSESLTGVAALGCALILLGVVMVEAGPALRNIPSGLRWLR